MSDELTLAKSVVDGELELLCPEMQLLSCPDYRSSMFDGTGLVRSRRGGRLSFEIVGMYESEFPPLVRSEALPHGQVPASTDHVMLRAVDSHGREWRSNWMMPRAFPPASRSHCWAVSCGIETLMSCEARVASEESEGRLYISSPGSLPFDMATHSRKAVGDRELESGWSLDHHVRTIDSANVEFRERDSGWLTVRARQQNPVMPDWAGLMCQALSVATAQSVRPVVAVREFNARKDVGIFSGPFSHPRSYLTRPVPPAEKQDFWSLVQKFFEWARSVDGPVASGVFDELEGIRNGSMGSMRTAALTLAVAVESLGGFLLTDDKSRTESRNGDIDLLMEHVGGWDGDANTRHRALSMLGSLKRVRTVDRLHRFARSCGIPSTLVDGWKKLRDVTAHGKAPESAQALFDRYFSTTELAYRLVAFAVGYDGSICATATRGWGLDQWGFPLGTRPEAT